MRFIKDLKEGEQLTGHYLCKQKQILKSRSGKSYLSLKLQDKTGIADGKVWELNNDIQNFDENDFIRIDGSTLIYNNEIQLNIRKIRRSEEGEYDPYDYIPSTQKNVNDLYNEILEAVQTISNPYLKKLLQNFYVHNPEIRKKLLSHSAAKSIHHSYMGGLIEHTLSVMQICNFMSSRYLYVNRDILITTALLHDIGKIKELSEFPYNDYTDEGQLLGHIIIGAEMIQEESKKIDSFPETLLTLIKHSIISHHGEYEYGSPKLPKTIEAYILHCADNMDAKVKVFEEAIAGNNTAGSWVGYHRAMNRNIRKSDF